MRVGSANVRRVVRRYVRSSAIAGVLRCVVHRYTRVGLRCGCVGVVRLRIRSRWHVVRTGIRSSPVVLAMAEITTSRLR